MDSRGTLRAFLALWLAVCLALGLAACGAQNSTGGAQGGSTLPAESAGPAASTTSVPKGASTAAGIAMPENALAGPMARAMHFSIDDVVAVFVDLTENASTYTSIFDNPMLAFLQTMHKKYGMVTSLYCFYESYDGGFDLSMATTRFAAEFAQNANWLRVGFHARGDATRYASLPPRQAALDQAAALDALAAICGRASIDRMIRLHYYDATAETVAALAEGSMGIQGLLASNNPADVNYSLPQEQKDQLYRQDLYTDESGLLYTPTDLWLDEVEDAAPALAALCAADAPGMRSGLLTVFTHEWAMGDAKTMDKIEQCAIIAAENGCGFAFPLDFYAAQGLP